jgi:hypothetical protein
VVKDRLDQQAQLPGGKFSRRHRRDDEAGQPSEPEPGASRAAPAVRQLRDRGIVFEEYDLPDVKTVDGIAEHESGARGAWFKDPDGNVVQIGQYGK